MCVDSFKNICSQLLRGKIDELDTNSSQPSLKLYVHDLIAFR